MNNIQKLSKSEAKKIFKQYLLTRQSLIAEKEKEERKVFRIQKRMLSMANKFSENNVIDDNELTYLCIKKVNLNKKIEEINETLRREGKPLRVYLTLSKMR